MANYTVTDAYNAARAAGFSKDNAVIAAAVALAESGGNAAAKSRTNTNGSVDYGAWQINSVHKAILASGDPFNLQDNARMAKTVHQLQGWKAWSVYRSGAYRKHLPAAQKAAQEPESKSENKPVSKEDAKKEAGTIGFDPANPLASVTQALSNFSLQTTRFGDSLLSMMLAIVLFAIGAFLIFRQTDAGKQTARVTKAAVKVVSKI